MHELYLFDGAANSQGGRSDLEVDLSELDDYVVLSPEMLELIRSALADLGDEPKEMMH